MCGNTIDQSRDVNMRIRRGFILGVIVTFLLFIMGLTSLGQAFALEPRYYYVIYESGEIIHVGYVPFYIYMWRVSSLIFLAWVITYVAYIIKSSHVLDSAGVVYGISYVITHYIYLFTIGAPVIIYPFTYVLITVGKPLLYLDWGQVIALITIWRLYLIRRLMRGL
ncbi:hypothetical protein [Vulcanisaeta sp. JCM 16159]|uniref:hypothetical protein n=1 Tax=Vulcanisaeta sp. JCM 16159 TaxID=1295371 RepID=UPI0006D0F0EC|nr:hypothetical protein [Vulcanisaeta sp. JCM 16159]